MTPQFSVYKSLKVRSLSNTKEDRESSLIELALLSIVDVGRVLFTSEYFEIFADGKIGQHLGNFKRFY